MRGAREFAGLVVTLAGLPLGVLPRVASAQSVVMAPNAIVIDGRSRSSTFTVINTGDRAAEVRLSTQYGYPVTDSTGRMRLQTYDVADDTMPSAADWVQSYPARFILAAGSRRSVRVMASPPAALPAGEYWSRLIVATRSVANAPTADDESEQDGSIAVPGRSDVRIGLSLEIRSVLALFFRNGPVHTGVRMSEAALEVDGDSVAARVTLVRAGNAAFVGTLKATLRDAAGTIRSTAILPLGVYYSLRPRLTLPCPPLPPGEYRLSLELTSTRPDVANSMLLPIAPVRLEQQVTVPSPSP